MGFPLLLDRQSWIHWVNSNPYQNAESTHLPFLLGDSYETLDSIRLKF